MRRRLSPAVATSPHVHTRQCRRGGSCHRGPTHRSGCASALPHVQRRRESLRHMRRRGGSQCRGHCPQRLAHVDRHAFDRRRPRAHPLHRARQLGDRPRRGRALGRTARRALHEDGLAVLCIPAGALCRSTVRGTRRRRGVHRARMRLSMASSHMSTSHVPTRAPPRRHGLRGGRPPPATLSARRRLRRRHCRWILLLHVVTHTQT